MTFQKRRQRWDRLGRDREFRVESTSEEVLRKGLKYEGWGCLHRFPTSWTSVVLTLRLLINLPSSDPSNLDPTSIFFYRLQTWNLKHVDSPFTYLPPSTLCWHFLNFVWCQKGTNFETEENKIGEQTEKKEGYRGEGHGIDRNLLSGRMFLV